jgi:hypothetical protein
MVPGRTALPGSAETSRLIRSIDTRAGDAGGGALACRRELTVGVDEGAKAGFEIARQVVVLEQDAVLQSLVPTLDLLWT